MKISKFMTCFVFFTLITTTLAACGGTSAEDSLEFDAANSAENQEAAPQLSGSLTVYLPSPAGLADDLIAAFQAKTGVQVAQFQGTTGEILARLEAEAANPVADVVILASWSDGLNLHANGGLLEYVPAGTENLHDGFRSEDNTLFAPSASAVGIAYNTLLVPELSANWDELAGPEFADQLVFPDPERSGSASDFLGGYLNSRGEADGWNTWESLAANGMIVPGANAAALEAVVTGERGILVGGVDWNVFAAIERGEPINFFYPAGGTVINPRPAMILNTTQNLENAQAFMDFLFSDEAQQMVADAFLIPGRSDIRSDVRPNVDEIQVLDTDWNWSMENSTGINQRFNSLFQ